MNKVTTTVIVTGGLGDVSMKLAEYEGEFDEVRIRPVKKSHEEHIYGYEVTFHTQTPCTFAHHRELWNNGHTGKCPDCGLHIIGPARRK